MRRSFSALIGLAILICALFVATVDLHAAPHPESGGQQSLDLGATHAAETGHIESSGSVGEFPCAACLVLPQEGAGARIASDDGAVLEIAAALSDAPSSAPLSGAACYTASRAPPPPAD